MSFDVNPTELVAVALACVLIAVPTSLVLVGAVAATPRPSWNRAGLAVGLGLLLGVILALTSVFIGSDGTIATIGQIAMILGLLCVIAAGVFAVLTALDRGGEQLGMILAITGGGLVALGEPVQNIPLFLAMSSSVLVVIAGVIIELVAIAAIVGALAGITSRVPAVRLGLSLAGAITALFLLISVLILLGGGSGIGVSTMIVIGLVALAIGSIAGGVLETLRVRRNRQGADHTADPATSAGRDGRS
ncbi:hypothetical protein [Brachybacterium sp. Marseille-Q7125]|uniref:hypothetical protein n=1 Tax=Brachybacterium sp. Marseille-Q7125 TaxID=2932815 RepID=UPI001FF236A1|nr:hypothetical protein [Brachybacterium sp. Marseille-Q7125]